jgi:hypothetical protein
MGRPESAVEVAVIEAWHSTLEFELHRVEHSQLVRVSLRGTPRGHENRAGLPADAGCTLGREPAN